MIFWTFFLSELFSASLNWQSCQNNYTYLLPYHHYDPMIKAEDFKWLDRVYHLFYLASYLCLSGALTDCFLPLKWESLKKRRKDNRLILLYKGLKGKARIPTDDLIPKTRRGRNQHSLAFQIPSASKDVYMYSFFPQTIRDWNDLPESLICSSELSDDSISKFTSLARTRD